MNYKKFSQSQLIAELQKRDEQIAQLQEVSFHTKFEQNQKFFKQRELNFRESQKVAKLGHYSFDIQQGNWTNSEQLDVIFEIDENFNRDVEGWLKIVHPDYVESMQNHLMVDVIKNKKPFNKEYKIITLKSKTEKWVHGNGNLAFNEKGEPTEMFGTIQDITKRKLVEEALQERESKLKESQKAAKLGHYSFDIQQGSWTNSEQLDVIFEIDENFNRDVEGWLKIVHPDYVESMQNHLMIDVIQNKNPFNKEYKIITLESKTEKWVHGNGNLAFNEKGEPTEMFGTIQDITKRKLVEEALIEREAKLKESQKVAKLGHYYLNIPTGIWTNSEQLDVLFGIDNEFVRDAEGWSKIIHPDFAESVNNHLMVDVIQNKKPFNKEYKIITLESKTEKWVHGNGNLAFNEKGEPTEMFGTIQDITKRKLIEEALKESESKLLKLFEKSMDAIFVVDLQTGKYIDANKSAMELTGYSLSEIKKLKTKDITPIGATQRIKNLSQLGKVVDFGEIEYFHQNGTKRIATLSTIPITKKYLYGIAHDVTDQKEIEKEILEARNKALASDKMKSEFLAQMSHEIRSPINVIVSFLSLIKEETSNLNNEILDTSFSSIDSSTSRIIRTIDMILNMSDLQLGTYSVTSNEIEIKELLKILFSEYEHVAKSNNLELKILFDIQNDRILIDDYALKQIVANLIDNAIKYTDKGFIEIRLTEFNDKYHIEIEDTGIGISEDYLPDLFSAFSQETKGYSRRFDGTGLGLALVKKYCNLINADIKVKSIKDKGSTFSLQIPKN